MAKKQDETPQSGINSNTGSFTKGLVRDFDENFDPESSWPYARNAANNSKEGDVGTLGNEPSNYQCGQAPYTIIGRIHLFNAYWAIFSTDDVNSEIGIYDESLCSYRTVVNDNCLNFRRLNLVTGVAKENFDCEWAVYFADGRNVDRYINIGNPDLWPDTSYVGNNYYQNQVLWPGVQWTQECSVVNDCNTCEPASPASLDCDQIRINKLVKTPCIRLSAREGTGNLFNGSYIAFIAYVENGQKYGDYSSPSNAQSIFVHGNTGSSITIDITNLETESFAEFELVILSTINSTTNARKIGVYSCADSVSISLDTILDSLPNVPLEFLPIRNPLYETSDSIYETGNYLLKIGPRTTFDFNYQPLANQITTNWVAVRYPASYYVNGGSVVGYMRDEVYSFWIRWIYNTGEKSNSYHIPGRLADSKDINKGSSIFPGDDEYTYEIENTATFTTASGTAQDGGVIIAKGSMGYWQSTEKYPDKNPEVWNASNDPYLSGISNTDYDLCNKNIRHHKMPEDIVQGSNLCTRAVVLDSLGNIVVNPKYSGATHINIIGVQFSNIKPPVLKDDNGTYKVVPGIVGYEILRGSRNGNKSIIAKGIINNLRNYTDFDGNKALYQNYPYNPVKDDPFGTIDPTLSLSEVSGSGSNYTKITSSANIENKYFTFHSPDTSFTKPFLSGKELRIYTELGNPGNVRGNFEASPKHPKEKLLTNLAALLALVLGFAEGANQLKGKVTRKSEGISPLGQAFSWATPGAGASNNALTTGGLFTSVSPINLIYAGISGVNAIMDATGVDFLQNFVGSDSESESFDFFRSSIQALNGAVASSKPSSYIGPSRSFDHEAGVLQALPSTITTIVSIPTFLALSTQFASKNIELIYSFVKAQNYVYRSISHSYLHKDNPIAANAIKRSYINDSGYLTSGSNVFTGLKVNNIFRSSAVVLNTASSMSFPTLTDNSCVSIGSLGSAYVNFPSLPYFRTASCFYGAMKIRYRNQYGQLDSVVQIPLPCCQIVNSNNSIPSTAITYSENASFTTFNVTYSSEVLFGGDTYIGRYTEKNTFFYFYDWLYGEPDLTGIDYRDKYLVLYPRYYADFTRYDFDGFLGSIFQDILQPSSWDLPGNNSYLDSASPSETLTLGDAASNPRNNFKLSKKRGFMYLFQSGVRDFYVETDLNISARDWGALDQEKHYEVNSNLRDLFDVPILKLGNYYRLDNSVSVSKLPYQINSWGTIQDRYYDPNVAALCYRYLPNRVIYSLPNVLDGKKDGWRIFLPNNYRDFKSKVTAIRPIGKNGALMLFDRDSPVQIQGTETLESASGTKITVGDGALFNKPLQSLVNTDDSYEYGSCQDRFSILNTPTGIYWISQSLGKVFTVGEGLDEISASGMRWWFNKFLPYRILVDFPNFEAIDNPVVGVGCQAVYDNSFLMIYFSKRDYELRKDLPAGTTLTYVGGIDFILGTGSTEKTTTGRPTGAKIKLGDPAYFNDVSWTISYDPKTKSWISFHDWHPTLMLPSNQSFISINNNTFWRHNDRTDSYCNYYGADYPFQVEYVVDSGQTVNTLKNIEYILESYVYDTDGIDRFQLLDFNFDELTIYNTEQVSGKLNLNMAPKDDPFARLAYPAITGSGINIMYEKVEQKFRVNQFWDVTADRGEYNVNVQRPIWLTGWDGYKRSLNPANIDYNKSVFERKKFRHYYNNVLFTRKISGNAKMLMKISNNKNLFSPR